MNFPTQESDGGIQTLRIFIEELESHKRILQWSVKDRKEHELWDIGRFKINAEWDHYAVMVDDSLNLKILKEYLLAYSKQRNYFKLIPLGCRRNGDWKWNIWLWCRR